MIHIQIRVYKFDTFLIFEITPVYCTLVVYLFCNLLSSVKFFLFMSVVVTNFKQVRIYKRVCKTEMWKVLKQFKYRFDEKSYKRLLSSRHKKVHPIIELLIVCRQIISLMRQYLHINQREQKLFFNVLITYQQ